MPVQRVGLFEGFRFVHAVILRDYLGTHPYGAVAGIASDAAIEVRRARSQLLVWRPPGPLQYLAANPRTFGAGPYRPVRLWQIDVPAHAQPHERPDRWHAAHRRYHPR